MKIDEEGLRKIKGDASEEKRRVLGSFFSFKKPRLSVIKMVLGTFVMFLVGVLFSEHFDLILDRNWEEIGEVVQGDTYFFVALVVLSLVGWFISQVYDSKKRADRLAWEFLAADNQGLFDPSFTYKTDLKAVMLHEGTYRVFGPTISFKDNDAEVLFFKYRFGNKANSILWDKNRNPLYYPHSYYVLSYAFANSVPHMYLNYKKNSYTMSLGVPLHIPSEFEKEFSLSVPDAYNIEGHEIFTPDILAKILDLPFACDVELVDNHAYFFIDSSGKMGNILLDHAKIKEETEAISQIVSLLKPKLDRFRFAKIGDKSFYLK